MYSYVIHNKLMRLNRKFENNNSFDKLLGQGMGFKIGTIIFIIIAIFILNVSPFSRGVKDLFYSISSPVQLWLWEKGSNASGFFISIFKAENLKQENEFLKAQNQGLISENIELEKLKSENKILRIALGLGLEKEFDLEMAQVIGKEISDDYLIINKGFKDGIKHGFPVITENKVLTGKITEVYENISKVELLSSKNSSFDIEIFGKDIYSLAKGKGGFEIFLDLIAKEEEIKIGDKVITSALGGNFPKALLVGEIKNITKSDTAAFQQAEVELSFEIKDLKDVFIIKDFGSK